jgi:hypothetical protein
MRADLVERLEALALDYGVPPNGSDWSIVAEAITAIRMLRDAPVSEQAVEYRNSRYLTNDRSVPGSLVEKQEAFGYLREQYLPVELAGQRVALVAFPLDTTAGVGRG